MKKTIKSLLAIAIAAFAFTACSDVPEPEGYNPKQGDGLITYVAEGTGVATDPYNVAGVLEATKDLAKGSTTSTDIYVKGYVAEIDASQAFNASFGNITYYVTDSPEGKSKKFYVYRGLGLNGDKFTSADDLKVGDAVTICGKITNYNGTIEYTQGSKLVKLNDQTTGSGTGTGTTTDGTGEGTEAAPYDVTAAIAAASKTGVYVKAYIVGFVSGMVYADGATFSADGASATNLLIAATPDETDATKCMPVALPSGAVRTGLNLADNAGNYKKEVLLYGDITTYFSVPGIKNTSYAKIDGKEIGTKPGASSGSGETGNTGSAAAPLTVAEIYATVAAMAADTKSSADYYVKGKVSSVKYTFSAQYGTATFNISDDGTTNGNQFTCYGTYYMGNKAWVDGNTQIAVGDEVVVCGKVINYKGNQPEFNNKENYLISLNGATN